VSAGCGKVAVIFSVIRPKSGGTVPHSKKCGVRVPPPPVSYRTDCYRPTVLGAACSVAIRQNGGVARSGTVPFRNASHYIRGVGVLVSIIYAVTISLYPVTGIMLTLLSC